ncbi:23S rRNA (adenine(2503)-C(2))-methyltransferase RlmN [Leptospira sp. GIMC2001]|uniref:23S rRNA (adenine(2503)-C(2))-methyltransferase RlmN n=1 Tax=Leptospira sp. GIMC2001 TaxID=1513297 RepID=UPI00234BA0A7|nr:23S rRNA (adenine(2503)-C(2))-methyltransferase RlmN [Leptospira sp. GIMC2001]WCL48165.1 23S rRNA (adenine(2503)-C(2))-methyltransferase RlmN [Leptospira sp. GIMC2001]
MKEEIFNPKGKLIPELQEFLVPLGEPKFRATQIFEGIYKHRYRTWDEFTNLPTALREKLKNHTDLEELTVSHHLVSADGTQKFSFALSPGKEIEAVWIPRGDGERKTICISSQVGCTLNCKFCATGKLEFQGNLTTWQILDQVLTVERIVGDRATNIVFMGMGEPLHNYFEVIRAAKILNHENAFHLGAKRITISTAGVVPGIHRFIDNKEPFNFAISLNQPDPNTRSDIMDVNDKHDLSKLVDSAARFVRELDRFITFEYVMIPGVNMSSDHIKLLGKIAKKVDKCKFNVIPLNTSFHGWSRPSDSEVERFVQGLKKESRVPVMNRRSPGKEIGGACGMLALSRDEEIVSIS